MTAILTSALLLAQQEPGQAEADPRNPGDMGNLGTIMRTMLGFGLADLALVSPAADVFDPRAVRSSMGALFALRCEYFGSFEEYTARYSRNLYPFITDAEAKLGDIAFQEPFSLVFGNESSGLPSEFRRIGTGVSIANTRHIDSLNLPVAVAIGLYEATRGNLRTRETPS